MTRNLSSFAITSSIAYNWVDCIPLFYRNFIFDFKENMYGYHMVLLYYDLSRGTPSSYGGRKNKKGRFLIKFL